MGLYNNIVVINKLQRIGIVSVFLISLVVILIFSINVIKTNAASQLDVEFNSYVNILEPRSAYMNNRFNNTNDAIWATDSSFKSATNASISKEALEALIGGTLPKTYPKFTAAITLNGMTDYSASDFFNLGLGSYESQSIPLSFSTTPNTPKIVEDNAHISKASFKLDSKYELGLIIRNIDDPDLKAYLPLEVVNSLVTNAALDTKILNYDDVNLYGNNPTGSSMPEQIVSPFTFGKHFYFQMSYGNFLEDATKSGDSTVRDIIRKLIIGGQDVSGVDAQNLIQGKDLSILNTKKYTKTDEIFAKDSNIKIEFTISSYYGVDGADFMANSIMDNTFKPFLIGSTNSDLNALTSTDKISFKANKNIFVAIGTQAYVFTTALDAISVNKKNERMNEGLYILLMTTDPSIDLDSSLTASSITKNLLLITEYDQTRGAITSLSAVSFSDIITNINILSSNPAFTGMALFDLADNPSKNITEGGIYISGLDDAYMYAFVMIRPPVGYFILEPTKSLHLKPVAFSLDEYLGMDEKHLTDNNLPSIPRIINGTNFSIPDTGSYSYFIYGAICIFFIIVAVVFFLYIDKKRHNKK